MHAAVRWLTEVVISETTSPRLVGMVRDVHSSAPWDGDDLRYFGYHELKHGYSEGVYHNTCGVADCPMQSKGWHLKGMAMIALRPRSPPPRSPEYAIPSDLLKSRCNTFFPTIYTVVERWLAICQDLMCYAKNVGKNTCCFLALKTASGSLETLSALVEKCNAYT